MFVGTCVGGKVDIKSNKTKNIFVSRASIFEYENSRLKPYTLKFELQSC